MTLARIERETFIKTNLLTILILNIHEEIISFTVKVILIVDVRSFYESYLINYYSPLVHYMIKHICVIKT